MTADILRQQLAKIADLQAALDAIKTDILIQIKETPINV